MSYNRRRPRQGVRYGPPRERQRYSENGVIIGRLLGLGILLLTLGVLAAAALALVDDGRPMASASRTAAATAATSAGGTASTPAPSVAATVSALPTLSVVPTSFLPSVPSSQPPSSQPPLVQIGPGYITFGTRADTELRIVDPATSFAIGDRVIWSAYLTERTDSADLRIQIFKVDGTPPTGERLVFDEPVTPLVQGAQIFQRRIRPSEALDGPGVYVVRYVRGTDILSQGSLEITS